MGYEGNEDLSLVFVSFVLYRNTSGLKALLEDLPRCQRNTKGMKIPVLCMWHSFHIITLLCGTSSLLMECERNVFPDVVYMALRVISVNISVSGTKEFNIHHENSNKIVWGDLIFVCVKGVSGGTLFNIQKFQIGFLNFVNAGKRRFFNTSTDILAILDFCLCGRSYKY